MPKRADWPWYQKYQGPHDYRVRELLRAVMDLHAYYGDKDTWVWRGQANSAYDIRPGAHSRVQAAKIPLTDGAVIDAAEQLLTATRTAALDTHEGTHLPDIALLAELQHYGAATPLLDVSLDPLVALYMAVVSPDQSDDDRDGVLFAIKRPRRDAARPFDARNFRDIYTALPDDETAFYQAPDVSERLKIQRGHFLLGKVSTDEPRVGVPLTVESGTVTETWLNARMAQRGRSGPPTPATTDLACFRVPAQLKPLLRRWLEQTTDLTFDYVYPTAWHKPHLEAFCQSNNRTQPIS